MCQQGRPVGPVFSCKHHARRPSINRRLPRLLNAWLLAWGLHGSAVQAMKAPAPMPISSGSTYHLSAATISQLEQQTHQGDASGNAAFRLYQYHAFSSLNQDLARQWLATAAWQGHPIAQYNQGLFPLFLKDALLLQKTRVKAPTAAKVRSLTKLATQGRWPFARNPKGSRLPGPHSSLCFLRRHPVCASAHASIEALADNFASSKIGE